MKRLLYLQNSKVRQSVAKLDERFESWGLNVDRYWVYDGSFPESLSGYDGIFLTGSPHGAYEDIPFIHREHELIQRAAETGIPMLGVCFGHQILASALCGRDQVFRRQTCEVGYRWLDVEPGAAEDSVARDLVPRVYMFVWHNDEVRAGHPDMNILATTHDCPNHIWRFRDLPIWGIQGHPEITLEQSRIWFEQNRSRLEKDGAVIDELNRTADEAVTAKTMLTRFADLVKGRS